MTRLNLSSFLELDDRWDGYNARAITEAAITTGESLQAVPTTHGGVQIEMHAGGMDIEIDIHPDGHVESIFVERVGCDAENGETA